MAPNPQQTDAASLEVGVVEYHDTALRAADRVVGVRGLRSPADLADRDTGRPPTRLAAEKPSLATGERRAASAAMTRVSRLGTDVGATADGLRTPSKFEAPERDGAGRFKAW
jgi:hypothetical protein